MYSASFYKIKKYLKEVTFEETDTLAKREKILYNKNVINKIANEIHRINVKSVKQIQDFGNRVYKQTYKYYGERYGIDVGLITLKLARARKGNNPYVTLALNEDESKSDSLKKAKMVSLDYASDKDFEKDLEKDMRSKITTVTTEGTRIENTSILNVAKEMPPNMMKRWITQGDDKVRNVHKEANGQTVATDKPFIIGGEEIYFPGDPLASLWNTINCRCVIEIVDPDTEEEFKRSIAR